MSVSVARRVATRGAAILVVTLVVVGAGTAALLHRREVMALDRVLLAAAHGRAHPDVAASVEVEHSRSPVDAWLVEPGDPRVPTDLAKQALGRERPLYIDTGDERIVLLPFEVDDGSHDQLAAAAAPRVTISRSVGPFLAIYAGTGAFAAIFAMFVQGRVVRRSFAPLDAARAEAERVVGLGHGHRLTVAGPEEVRTLLAAINDLLERLDAAYHAQARFTAEAAHELRTPVTSMLGEVEVALRAPRTAEEYRATLTSVREDVERLRRLVGALLALARLDAGLLDGEREPTRAAELAGAALAAEAPLLTAAGCQARMDVAADPELEVHRTLVEVALGNLLRNVARHAPGAPVVLRVGREGAMAVFDVDDGGPGIPGERDGLFDRFARGAEARRNDREGLGLGLPLTREVARRHGGDCVLLPSPLGGLRARLLLRCEPEGPGDVLPDF